MASATCERELEKARVQLAESQEKQAKLERANTKLKYQLNFSSRNYRTALKQMNRKMSASSRESQFGVIQSPIDLLRQQNEELICRVLDSDSRQQIENLKGELELTRGKLEAAEARILVVENEKTGEEIASGSAVSDLSRENIELRKKNATLCGAMVELLQTKMRCDEQASTIKALENQMEETLQKKASQLKASRGRENRLRRFMKRKKVQKFGINSIRESGKSGYNERKRREEVGRGLV